MLFNSVVFITVFLPLALLGWYLLQQLKNPGYAKIFLIGMSFWFYGYYNVSYLWILIASLAMNYLLSILMEHGRTLPVRKGLLLIGIFGNLGLLFYFKYFNFFLDNCNFFFHTDFSVEKIALPLGISFFTFQQLSFVIERYRGGASHYPLLDYCLFISFFPQLIAGPIVLHSELIPQIQARKNRIPSWELFYDGITLFVLGLGKKVLLADILAVTVNAEFGNIAALDAPCAWIVIFMYMMELYFDFSGYCDMARGIGYMFGFRLPENFDSPFHATSVKEFWRRWHMTLSRFLTQYIYIPLGGNRRGKARQCVNLFLVFLISGLWHGANWTFVVWGIMHGLALVFETLFPKLRFKQEWLNRLKTAIFVTLSFSIFRSDSLADAALLWSRLFAGGFKNFFPALCNTLRIPENYALIKLTEMVYPKGLNLLFCGNMILLLLVSVILIQGKKAEEWLAEKGKTRSGTACMAFLFLWAFISLSQVSVFLYFNF